MTRAGQVEPESPITSFMGTIVFVAEGTNTQIISFSSYVAGTKPEDIATILERSAAALRAGQMVTTRPL